MSQLRIVARTLVVNNSKILLVRNKNADFWYPPGGGWEYEQETIIECASREVKEETGYNITIDRLLWLQEFHTEGKIFFETFWLAQIDMSDIQDEEMLEQHIDLDPNGLVEEVRWCTQDELKNLKIFPERIKTYTDYIEEQSTTKNPFIGIFK
jgi:ADP-ribose pyrophosphatase YjhB (NUDIX family)